LARAFLDDRGKEALRGAVRAVEERSAAEVVILVRERSGPYLHASLLSGAIAAYLTLWFQLFSPWEYSLLLIQLAPAVAGTAIGLLTSVLPDLQRLLTPGHIRESYVRTKARAAFHDHGVADTRGRTGILVYVSRLEREAEVLADRGVRDAVEAQAWEKAAQAIRSAAGRRRPDAAALAITIASLGDLLQPVLPRQAGDVNELADEPA
jgi:putative membrane protein